MSSPSVPSDADSRWTPERQLRFLEAIARMRSVKHAAAAAGMSRESAYRLRARSDGLFALLWDRAMESTATAGQGHTGRFTDGQMMRLLGNQYRRENQDFVSSLASAPGQRAR